MRYCACPRLCVSHCVCACVLALVLALAPCMAAWYVLAPTVTVDATLRLNLNHSFVLCGAVYGLEQASGMTVSCNDATDRCTPLADAVPLPVLRFSSVDLPDIGESPSWQAVWE